MWIAVVSEFQFSFGFRKKEFQTFRLQLGAGGVRNPDRSGSGSGLVAATSLDWAHEVDQDQVFHDLGQAHTPRWGSRPMGPRALQILEGFGFHRFPAANGQAVSLRRRRPTGDGGGVVRSFDFEAQPNEARKRNSSEKWAASRQRASNLRLQIELRRLSIPVGNKVSIFGADSLVRDKACTLNFHSHFHYQSIIAKAEESDNQIYQSQLPIHHFPFLR